MTTKQILVAASVACFAVTSASAGDVYLTGSSAFRSNIMAYLRGKITNDRAVFDKAVNADFTKSVDASSYIVLSGTYLGNPITFYCAWTGAVAGTRTVVNSENVAFPVKPADFDTNANYLLDATHSGVQGTSAGSLGEITSASFNHIPDFGFEDHFQASTVFTAAANETKIGVIPFQWVAGEGGAASGITNMTSQIAQQLFKNGTISLAHFSGNAADATSGYKVYAVGRWDDSGTRLISMAESGVGVSSSLIQYTPNGDPVTSWTSVGNGGYVSGSQLAGALGRVTTKANGHSVGYAGVPDAITAVAAGATTMTHNGVALTSVSDVTEGRYTFWSYEQVIDRGDLSGQALDFLTLIQTDFPTSFTSTTSKIKLSDMKCERSGDGELVFHFD